MEIWYNTVHEDCWYVILSLMSQYLRTNSCPQHDVEGVAVRGMSCTGDVFVGEALGKGCNIHPSYCKESI